MGMTDVAQYFTAKATGDAVTAGSTASSNIIDLGRTKPQIGVGQLPLVLEIRTVVAAGGSGTVQFALRKSATQTAGALGGTITILLTPAMTKGSDSRIDTAGNYVLRVPLPYEADQRYLDILAVLTGTATITYEARIAEAPSDKHTQVMASNVGNP